MKLTLQFFCFTTFNQSCLLKFHLWFLNNFNMFTEYDTIGEFNVDWKAEYSALSSTRSQKKKLKQPTPVPL